ncbi:MAG: hypothetical protein NVS2B15_20690 [Pseudarthrobacter sp.]
MGYSLAGLGPLLFGLLHDLSGGWTASFTLLCACLLALTAGLLMINQPRMLEDISAWCHPQLSCDNFFRHAVFCHATYAIFPRQSRPWKN